jgi:hypothetical protein
MKVGLDLDFTITEIPEFFSILSEALIKKKHEVHIITYRDEVLETTQLLRDLGISYTKLWLPGETDDMSQWKARIASDIGLDVMIDDAPEILNKMPNTVKRMWMCDPDIFNLGTCIKAMRQERSGTQGIDVIR